MLQIISEYLNAFILLTSVVIYGKIVLNKSTTLSQTKKIVLFQIICIIQAITFIKCDGTLKTLIILITNTFFNKKYFNISYLKAVFMTFLYMILLIIPDMIEIFFMTSILHMSKDYIYNSYASGIISNLVVCTLLILITRVLKKQLRRLLNAEISNNVKIIILSIITLIPISLFFYSFVKTFEFSNDIIQYLIAIGVLSIILFTLIKQTIENNKITKEYDNLLGFMTTYENEIEKQRILRHETKNEFLAIRAKICDNQKNKEIVNYIDEILKDKIKVKQEQYAKFGYLPPNGIKGLCYFKVQVAEENNIKVALNISKRIKDSSIYKLNTKQQREFGRILGVLLDNAIEASIDSEDKQLGIEAYSNKNNEFKMIISNTYNNVIDSDKVGKERFSNKGKNRGHGLLLIKHIINENKRFELKTSIQEKTYSQSITIKNIE